MRSEWEKVEYEDESELGRRFGIEPDWEKVEEALGEINESEWGRLFGIIPEMEIEPEKEK